MPAQNWPPSNTSASETWRLMFSASWSVASPILPVEGDRRLVVCLRALEAHSLAALLVAWVVGATHLVDLLAAHSLLGKVLLVARLQ